MKQIRETLVHSNLPQESSSPCDTFPCGVGQCKTCKFIDSSTTIQVKQIRETLVHSNLPQELSSPCGTFPCGVGQCKTCKFLDSSTTISAPKCVYHIKHHFTCTSSHLIYCLSCSRCGMLYIGKTGRCLRTRFGEHRRSVTSSDANQPVARHFNNGSHCVSDMKIRALCPISGSNDSRKRHEMRLISKLGIVHPLGVNERFSYI